MVSVSFHAPAFSTKNKDQAALSLLLSLSFGRTSPLYKRLVQDEQKMDQLYDYTPGRVDPTLATIGARVKKTDDAVYVRDAILRTVAQLRSSPVGAQNLADAKSALKYGLIRSLDNTEQIAGTLASFVHYQRAYGTINDHYRLMGSLTPADLLAAAREYLVDDGMVVTTLSHGAMADAMAALPKLAGLAPAPGAAGFPLLAQPSALPQIRYKLLFSAGFREDDFRRLKEAQKNALLLDLKDNNEEEFGKERLQANVYAGSGYGHPVLGTVKGIDSISLDDVKAFWKSAYTQGALRVGVGVAGDAGPAMAAELKQSLAALPAGAGLPATHGLARLTVADVNAAIRKHLSAKDLSVVIITKDAAGLKDKLVSDAFSPIKYDGNKPQELLDEDRVIGARKLNIAPEAVAITPAAQAFAE